MAKNITDPDRFIQELIRAKQLPIRGMSPEATAAMRRAFFFGGKWMLTLMVSDQAKAEKSVASDVSVAVEHMTRFFERDQPKTIENPTPKNNENNNA